MALTEQQLDTVRSVARARRKARPSNGATRARGVLAPILDTGMMTDEEVLRAYDAFKTELEAEDA